MVVDVQSQCVDKVELNGTETFSGVYPQTYEVFCVFTQPTVFLWVCVWGRVQVCSQGQVWFPVGLVGDGQAGQPGAVIIHDVV